MSIEGLGVSFLILLITGLWIGAPLLRRPSSRKSEDVILQKQQERLVVYYERVLTNLRDLDEDFATGKMNPEDYEVEREEWIQRGIQALKAFDQLEAKQPLQQQTFEAIATESDAQEAVDDAIEAAVAAYRRG